LIILTSINVLKTHNFYLLFQGCGQLTLAYLTATAHGLTDEAESLAPHINEDDQAESVKATQNAELMIPSPPLIQSESNWPLLTVSKVIATMW